MKTIQWLPAWPHLTLTANEVHIWRRPLLAEAVREQENFALLSEDERQRAQRFYFAKHRRRFTMARAGLRKILSHYLPAPPENVHFSYGQHGKPAVDCSQSDLDVRFNVSHSHEMALYAITVAVEIGIDIEKISTRKFSYQELAQRYFAEDECTQLLSLAKSQQESAFFHIWTQKEAFIKALGQGLAYPLDKFTVNAVQPASLLHAEDNNVEQWFMQAVAVAADYQATFATAQPVKKICYWHMA
ncbi:MAG: 4'-phosphopantetheinyl transferase superfamily protein [Gammaproteobacteria bacterium]